MITTAITTFKMAAAIKWLAREKPAFTSVDYRKRVGLEPGAPGWNGPAYSFFRQLIQDGVLKDAVPNRKRYRVVYLADPEKLDRLSTGRRSGNGRPAAPQRSVADVETSRLERIEREVLAISQGLQELVDLSRN